MDCGTLRLRPLFTYVFDQIDNTFLVQHPGVNPRSPVVLSQLLFDFAPGRKPSYGRLAFYVTTLFIPLTPNVRGTPVLPANVNFTPHPLRIWVSRWLFKRGRRVAESLHLWQEWAVIMMDELQFVHGPIYSDTSAITDGLDADVVVATM